MTVIEKQYMETVIRMGRRLQSGEIDWEQRRYEIAKDCMAAMLGNPAIVDEVTEDGEPVWGAPVAIAKTAATLATLLVEELKGENNNG
ncbi:hypothetical protein [Duncaniella muris]|uniref:hypothetical protein n=1 Tax=Duncaniella muris TaxID=2094150 RepID=UPI0025AFACEE|nr:hypothetical protein [Duncaniella muris]